MVIIMEQKDILLIHLRVQLDTVNDLVEHGVKDSHVLKKEIELLNQYAYAYNKECRKQDPTLCIKEVDLNE